jgi:hypothetical protein
MQDHICRIDENLLHRTAGPYIRVKSDGLAVGRSLPLYPYQQTFPDADGMPQGCQQPT